MFKKYCENVGLPLSTAKFTVSDVALHAAFMVEVFTLAYSISKMTGEEIPMANFIF